MKITCQKSALQDILKLTARGVKRNSPLPILQSIKLETDSDLGLSMTATDYELEIRCSVGCQIHEPGSVIVPAKQFLEIVGAADGSEIQIAANDRFQVQVTSGRSRFRLNGIDPHDFPLFPVTHDEAGLILPQSLLRDMFSKVAHAVARDETRPALTGALWTITGAKARLAATDAHRLMVYDMEFDGEVGRDSSVILPKRVLTEMPHFLHDDEEEEVELRVDDGQVEFKTGSYTVKGRLIAGPFPNIDRVIGLVRDHSFDVSLSRLPLIDALKRVDILARDECHQVRWEVMDGLVRLSTIAQQIGESEEDLEIGDSYAPEKMVLWFRADQLLDVLTAYDSDAVSFVYQEPARPVLVYAKERPYFEILMPLIPPQEEPA